MNSSSAEYVRDVIPIRFPVIEEPHPQDLERFVEEPLRDACLALYRKGIGTVWTSANVEDIDRACLTWLEDYAMCTQRDEDADLTLFRRPSLAALVIDYDTLSEANRRMADSEMPVYWLDKSEYDVQRIVLWTMPLTENTRVEEVAAAAQEFVGRFADQTA